MLVRLGLRAAILVIVLLFGFAFAAFELPRGIGISDAYFPTRGNSVRGRSLDDFFHAWLYDPIVPALP